MPKIHFNRSKHQGKDAYFLEARIGNLSSKETLLVDTGADYLTVSNIMAEQLDIDLESETNSELTLKYHSLEDGDFNNFFESWKKEDKKGIKTYTDSATTQALASILYPVQVEFNQDVTLEIPVNFVKTEVSIPMLGRRGFYQYCKKMIIKTQEGEGYFEVDQ